MFTYLMFKVLIHDILVEEMLDGDAMSKSIAFVVLPLSFLLGLLFIFIDVIFIPFYLLIGLVYLFVKTFERD